MKIRRGQALIEAAIAAISSQFQDAIAALDAKLLRIQPGSISLEDLKSDLDNMLDVARDGNSGTTLLTGSEQTLYEETPSAMMEFKGGFIDLTNLADTREVVIRTYAKIAEGGSYIQISDDAANTYTVADIPTAKLIRIEGFFNRYGHKVTIEQTVEGGGYINIGAEFVNAAPGI